MVDLTKNCEVIIIIGSPASSNSNRLKERAEEEGIPSFIIDSPDEFQPTMIAGRSRIGISSGASVPDHLINQLVSIIQKLSSNASVHQEPSQEGDIWFPIPKVLRDVQLS